MFVLGTYGYTVDHCFLLKTVCLHHPQASTLDLKAYAHGDRHTAGIINRLPQKTPPVFWSQVLNRLTTVGRIHPAPSLPNAPNLANVLVLETGLLLVRRPTLNVMQKKPGF